VDLYQPYTGVLYLPDKPAAQGVSPVLLADGRTVAQLRWHVMSAHQAFEVLDPESGAVAASGRLEHALGRRYAVHGPDGRSVLVEVKLGVLRPFDGATITLAGGTVLGLHGRPTGRDFDFIQDGAVIAQIRPTTGLFTFHPDSYEFDLPAPVLSIAAAVGLAQALREAAKAIRRHEQNNTHLQNFPH
jgi:hypothetical protein